MSLSVGDVCELNEELVAKKLIQFAILGIFSSFHVEKNSLAAFNGSTTSVVKQIFTNITVTEIYCIKVERA